MAKLWQLHAEGNISFREGLLTDSASTIDADGTLLREQVQALAMNGRRSANGGI
jgi:hypothetical protein